MSALSTVTKQHDDGHADIHAASVSSADVSAQPTSAVISEASVMLRCLSSCRDVQFTLMQMLTIEDLSRLDASCHWWRASLLHPPHSDALTLSLGALTPARVLVLAECEWARRLVVHLHQRLSGGALALSTAVPSSAEAQAAVGGDQGHAGECRRMLLSLTRFPRMRDLRLHLLNSLVQDDALTRGLAALAAQLRCLHFETPGHTLLAMFLSALGPLRALEEIHIKTFELASSLPFDSLPLLPALRSFTLRCTGEYMDHRCSPAQVACLARCHALTHLDCGSWAVYMSDEDEDGSLREPEAEEAQLARGLGALVAGLGSLPGGQPPRLQHLALEQTAMSPIVLEHLTRLPSLARVWPEGWLRTLGALDWALLSRFLDLRELKIASSGEDYSEALLPIQHIFPPLLQCRQLRILCLSDVRLSGEQLDALCRTLTELRSLDLAHVWLEDCAGFASAPQLSSMALIRCMGVVDGRCSAVQFRSLLPPMHALTTLTLRDPLSMRLTNDEAAPLNALLLHRMPMLRAEGIDQELRARDNASATAADQ